MPHWLHKRHAGHEKGAKRKNGGRTPYKAQDLLPRAAVDVLSIEHSRQFNKKKFAGRFIVEHYVCTAIKIHRICWNVEAWNWVIEHQLMAIKNIPVSLGNTIPCFVTPNGGKIKWSMDISVHMTYIEPFPETHKFVVGGIAVGGICRSNQVSLGRQARECQVANTVKLQPISLVNRVVTPIIWVANIKFEKEPAVRSARRIEGHGFHESNPCEPPFPCIVVAEFA
jgi:hypothetical protein